MGDEADRIIEDGLLSEWGVCEDPQQTYDGEWDMAEYKAVVDFGLWPNDGRSGNQPHHRSGKIEMSDALLREMVDARKRGENVVLQVAAWDNTSRDNPNVKYLGCKLSCNGWLMNNEAKKKESGLEGTYPEEEKEEENNEVGSDGLFD